MATSGDCYSSYARNTRFRVHWERIDTWNNSNDCGSIIKWTLYLENGNYWYNNAIKCYPIYINNSEVYGGGTWSNYTSSGTYELASDTTNLPHNDDGTKIFNINFSGWFYSSYEVSGSQDFPLETIPRYANFTEHYVKSKTINTMTIKWAADASVNRVRYSLDGGSHWNNTSENEYTISNLEPNTTYKITTEIRRSDSGLTTTSTTNATTYNIAKLTEVPNVNIGEAQTIKWTNPSGEEISLKLYKTNGEELITDYGSIEGTEKEITEDSDTIYNLCPNSNEYTARYYLYTTCNGVTYNDYKDFNFVVTNSNPTFNAFRWTATGPTDLTGDVKTLIKGYSGVFIMVSNPAKGVNGAIIKSYRFIVGSKTFTRNVTNQEDMQMAQLSNVDDKTILAYAIDSRGNSTLVQYEAPFIEYKEIIIKNVIVEREENGVGKGVTLNFSGIYWNKSFGEINNEIKSIKYYYKETSSSEWVQGSTELSTTVQEDQWSGSASIKGDLGAEGFDAAKSYDIRLEVTDCLVTKTYDVILGSGTPALAIYENKVAQGKKYDTSLGGDFQMNGEVYLNGTKLPSAFIEDPIGSIKMFAGSTIPNTWLLCDGSAISRTTYADLFSVIGTDYGSGDGSTTFNLPDLRGNVPVGLKEGDNDFSELGKTGGEKTHLLVPSELPGTVTVRDNVTAEGYGNNNWAGPMSGWGNYQNSRRNWATTDQPHNNVQPYITVNYIIKAIGTIGTIETEQAQVIDNLTSTSSKDALSANQGRILNEKIEGYVPEIITGYINRKSFTQSQAWNSINLAPFDKIVKTTDRITATSTGFKIGAGISKILVSAHCQGIDHSSFPGDKTFTIIKNGTSAIRGAESYITNQGNWCPHDITPLLIDCNESDIKENDVLSIYMGGGGTGTGELLGEYLTIQIIE